MKNILRLSLLSLSILVISIVITSCKKDPFDPNENKRLLFETVNSVSIYVDGAVAYEFDLKKHQVVYTMDKKMYMITNLQQTECYTLTISSTPVLNSIVNVTQNIVGIASLSPNTYTMQVIKVQGGKFWLWDNEIAVGFVLDFL